MLKITHPRDGRASLIIRGTYRGVAVYQATGTLDRDTAEAVLSSMHALIDGGYDPALALSAHMEWQNERPDPTRQAPTRPSEAVLYGIRSFHLIKVGITHDVSRRLLGMRLHNPHALDIVVAARVPSMFLKMAEQTAHRLLGQYGVGREWFSCSDETAIQAIRDAIQATGPALPWKQAALTAFASPTPRMEA